MTTPEEAVREARTKMILALGFATEAYVLSYGEAEQREKNQSAEAAIDALLTAERARLAARVTALRFDLRGADDGDGHFDEWEEMHPQGRYLDADAVLALLRETP
mgnify:CR=1 FL=1